MFAGGKKDSFKAFGVLTGAAALIFLFLFFYFRSVEFGGRTREERLVGSIGGIPQTSFNSDYPRLFNQYLLNDLSYPGIQNALKNWDYVILSDRVSASEASALRSLNPNIKIGRYMSPTSVYESGNQSPFSYTRDYYNKVASSNWWMHNTSGGIIITWPGSYNSLGTNFTSFAPIDGSGQKFYDWFPQFVYDRIISGLDNDFILADEIYSGYVWLEGLYGNGQIDVDNDGIADDNAAVDSATRSGLEALFTNLRNIMNAGGQGNKIIVGNGVNIGSYYPQLFNGAMRETFPFLHGNLDPSPNPFGYHWKDNVFNSAYGYLATESAMRQPNFSLIAAHPLGAGNDPLQPSINSDFERHLRFSLGSALLGNGYFGISNWSSAWWFNNYYTFNNQKGYLGSPQENYRQILVESRQGSSYGVYERNFSGGKVIVNASGYSQDVALNGNFLKVQDSSSVSGSVTIPAWDALILVNAPPPQCAPNWACTGWSSCSGGTQSRTCNDQNNCGTNEGRPPESQNCSSTAVYVLTISKTGNGSGDVVSGEGGINCGSDCTESYAGGTPVVLTANPSSNSRFVGWSGDCSGGGSCVLTMNNGFSATANFELVTATQPQTLSVALNALPSSGNAPLNGVDLTANVSGSAEGNINYTFYCNRSDSGVNITSPYALKIDGRSEASYLASDICSFGSAGVYSAKVIVERGTALPAEARVVINVSAPPPPVGGPPPTRQVCGNGICESGEASNNCAFDCKALPPTYLPPAPTSTYVPPIPQEVIESVSKFKTSLKDLSSFFIAIVALIFIIALFY